MNKSSKICATILIIIFVLAPVGILISIRDVDQQTEETTTLYSGTISYVDIRQTGERMFVEIYTKEHHTSLLIHSNVSENINMSEVCDLKSGQTIYFRIENIKVKQFGNVDFIDIISLNTDAKSYFSLDEYNKFIHNSVNSARIACVIISLLSLVVLYCLNRRFKGQKGQRDGSPRQGTPRQGTVLCL